MLENVEEVMIDERLLMQGD